MPGPLDGKRILILSTHGFEQSELEVPRDELKKAGATVDVVSPEKGEIKGWDKTDWGRPVKVDKALDAAKADDYDAIVLPGGQINPDLLRVNKAALALIKAFYDSGKTVAAVCHAPWLLVEDRHRQGPQDDLLQIHPHRRHQCRREMGGFTGGGRPGRDHLAQPRRSRRLLRQDRGGGSRGPASAGGLIEAAPASLRIRSLR